MSALEQEIIEKFHRLGTDAKQRVLQTLAHEMHSPFDYDVWWAEVEALQTDIRARLGETATIGALSLLDGRAGG
jgi:hypothetical protein